MDVETPQDERPALAARADSEDALLDDGGGMDQSLAGRMEQRAQELAMERTEWFTIPGWDDIFEVQLRSLGFRTIKKAVTRNRSVREEDTRDLYSMCDNLIMATVGFRRIDESEPEELPGVSWKTLAGYLPNAPANLSQRQGLLLMLGETRIMFLLEEYTVWSRDTRAEIDKEAAEDFGSTG